MWSALVSRSGDGAPSYLLDFLPAHCGGHPRPSTHCPFETSLHQPSSFSQQERKLCPDLRGPGAVSSLLVGTNLRHL